MNDIYLTKEDLDKINKLKDEIRLANNLNGFKKLTVEMHLKSVGFIGMGQDGYVFKKGNKTYKIYKTDLDRALEDNYNMDIDIKPALNYPKNNTESHFRYYDASGVRLSDIDAFYKILSKQENINLTRLPNSAIYREDTGSLVGVLGKYYEGSIGIYNAWNLPFKKRLDFVNKLIEKCEELMANGVYHLDLAQIPSGNNRGSNVLISKNNPEIIDIDGHSAVYIDKSEYNKDLTERYKRISTYSLVTLALDLIGRMDIEEYINEGDYETISYELLKYGIEEDFIEEVLSDAPLEVEELKEQIKKIDVKKHKL